MLLLIPIVVQQFITNFVSLLDNIMVGQLGTESISAASIANSVQLVFMLAVFGGLSGFSIFGAQFYGKGDTDGVRNTFRVKILFCILCTAAGILIYRFFGHSFIHAFLLGESNGGDMALALREGTAYLMIMLWGLLPFAFVQAYAGTLREAGETVVPMAAGICAILTNLFLNWVLIFGKLGAPALGVRGAAIATVISRYVELLVVLVYAYTHLDRYPFIRGALPGLKVPMALVRRMAPVAAPLHSSRGLNAVAALNINGTAWNLFCVIMFAMGTAISIMVGQRLGAGRIDEARDVDRKLLFLTVSLHVLIGAGMILASPYIPRLYNVIPEVRTLTSRLLVVAGLSLPIHSFAHATYFTIRSGGRTVITFLFDAVYTWAVTVLLAFCLCRFTNLEIVKIYFCVQFIDVIKVVLGLLMLRSDFWARNVVSDV